MRIETPKPYTFKAWTATLAAGIDPLRLDEIAQQMEDDATLEKLVPSRPNTSPAPSR